MKKLLCLLLVLPLSAVSVARDSARQDAVIMPVIMYHTILNSRDGVYIVSEAQLENDLKELIARGYEFVFPSEVAEFVSGEGSLPEKPVMLTFDDGHYNNLYYGLPILEKYGAKANINIIGRFSEYTTASGDVDNPNYSHLTWEEIATMWDSGVFEVGNHTYDMHNYKPRYGIAPKSGESEEAYRAALKSDISRLQEKTLTPSLHVIITVNMTCNEGVNVLRKGETERLSYIRRYNRSGRYSTRDFLDRIARDEKKARESL